MGDRLKLVRRFDELFGGAVVADLRCECGRFHYANLVELVETERPDGSDGPLAWRGEPDCNPDREPDHFCGVDAAVVAQNRIYLVEENADDLAALALSKVRETIDG